MVQRAAFLENLFISIEEHIFALHEITLQALHAYEYILDVQAPGMHPGQVLHASKYLLDMQGIQNTTWMCRHLMHPIILEMQALALGYGAT